MSASFDYSLLDMNTAQQAYADCNPPRRVSWDDSSLYYQAANEWDYSVTNNYKSQNPSPKHANINNNGELSPSPLTTINGYQQDSETEDMESSASSIDENIFNQKSGSRISLEDIDTDDEYDDDDGTISMPLTDDENEKDNVSIKNEKIRNEINSKIYSFNDKDMKLIIMESKVNDLNDKMGILMQIVKKLKNRNQYLETSKLRLINNTSKAINGCRDHIKKLTKENEMLLEKVNLKNKKDLKITSKEKIIV